jgi:hypothetical protein
MGVIMAFLVGYVLGTRAGREGMEQLLDAVGDIAASEEVQGLVTTGLHLVGGPLREVLLPGDARASSPRSSVVVEMAMGVLNGLSRRAA